VTLCILRGDTEKLYNVCEAPSDVGATAEAKQVNAIARLPDAYDGKLGSQRVSKLWIYHFREVDLAAHVPIHSPNRTKTSPFYVGRRAEPLKIVEVLAEQ
jgi:hypothetical protein